MHVIMGSYMRIYTHFHTVKHMETSYELNYTRTDPFRTIIYDIYRAMMALK